MKEMKIIKPLFVMMLMIAAVGFVVACDFARSSGNPDMALPLPEAHPEQMPDENLPSDLDFCDANTPCKIGQCVKFPGEKHPVCYEGDPCERCGSRECIALLSYPPQIMCVEAEK